MPWRSWRGTWCWGTTCRCGRGWWCAATSTSCAAARAPTSRTAPSATSATVVHACRIADACLIGMGSILLDGVVVEKHGFVGAGALVPPGKVVGSGEMWLGNPARKARMLSDQEIEALYYSAQHYVRLKDEYLS